MTSFDPDTGTLPPRPSAGIKNLECPLCNYIICVCIKQALIEISSTLKEILRIFKLHIN